MSTKKIYLIRHGQTDYNVLGIVQGGGVDTDLNEVGRAQALAFYKQYHNISFDKVYTSTLKRSIQSVSHFIESKIPHERHAGLNEISWGIHEGKAVTIEENTVYHSVVERWSQGEVDLKMEGGESPVEVSIRQKLVMDLIFSREDEKTILICMHGRAMRILLATLLNYEVKCMDEFPHHNLGLYLLNYTGSMCSVELFNDIEHLGKMP